MKNRFVNWIKAHKLIIILIFLAVVLLAGNICILLFLKTETNQGAWLTLFGGWVSGVATLVVGIIAFWQSHKYEQISRRQNLINQITNYMSEFQVGFIQQVQVERMIKLNYRIRQCHRIKDEARRRIEELKLYEELIYLVNCSLLFEAVLLKSNYCSEKIIELHKMLQEIGEKFKDTLCEKSVSDCDRGSFENLADYILQWTHKVDRLANFIMLEYHELRLQFLKNENTQEYQTRIEKEEQAIIDYFRSVSEEYING